MKWIVLGLLGIALVMLVYFTIMFIGPRMRVTQQVRSFQKSMPQLTETVVPVEADRYRVPDMREATGMKNPLSKKDENVHRGKVYYEYYCIFCHGTNGQGDGPVGYSYMPSPVDLHDPKILRMKDGELFRSMLVGIGHEPVLPRVVLPEHRWYLVVYVRELGKTPREPAENPGSFVIPEKK